MSRHTLRLSLDADEADALLAHLRAVAPTLDPQGPRSALARVVTRAEEQVRRKLGRAPVGRGRDGW